MLQPGGTVLKQSVSIQVFIDFPIVVTGRRGAECAHLNSSLLPPFEDFLGVRTQCHKKTLQDCTQLSLCRNCAETEKPQVAKKYNY